MTITVHIKTLLDQANLWDLVGDVRSPGYPDRLGHYQYTHSGRLFWSCDPRPEEVFIEDISTHLSRLCRFNGATKRWMSVAEHCWIASYQVPEEDAFEALMHDAAEAYIGDMIRPLKTIPALSTVYLKIEAGIEKAVAARYGLNYPWPASVKRADEAVVTVEVAQNIASGANNHLIVNFEAHKSDDAIALHYWGADLARAFFLQRFYELSAKRGIDAKAA